MAGRTKKVETLTHAEAKRKNIPTAEMQSLVTEDDTAPAKVAYQRDTPLEPGTTRPRNPDLDPQLVWRGKDQQDWSDLVVQAPPIYIQEKVHPKAIIDDLRRRTQERRGEEPGSQFSFFDDFNGLPDEEAKLEFYQHDQHWSNRMILGDSLQVMASLAEKEGLRGQVQCIYIDPPYGIKFKSNWQVSTRSLDVKDKIDQLTREPEQVKAFRDTWRDGIHTYLTYLRDRLVVSRDLLSETGSIFVQIGEDNVHIIRSLLDEIFGCDNSIVTLIIKKKSSSITTEPINDYILWYSKNRSSIFVNRLVTKKNINSEKNRFKKIEMRNLERLPLRKFSGNLPNGCRLLNDDYPMVSQDHQEGRSDSFDIQGESKFPGKNRHWTLDPNVGMRRLEKANRLRATENTIRGVVYFDDYGQEEYSNIWDFHGERNPIYVVQTNKNIVERCVLMTTNPGDLVLDPTCGSGTTAYASEQWGRRWIMIDTSRVALALARSRLMGARYPYYLLTDSEAGLLKEAEIAGGPVSEQTVHGDMRQGFVYQRVPHVTLKAIANNGEIDVIWTKWQEALEPLRHEINAALGKSWKDWEIPREADANWPQPAKDAHAAWWEARIARQREIDESIARKAEQEYLYDKPYEDSSRVRVAGPFTVESLSPHRVIPTDDDAIWEDLIAAEAEEAGRPAPRRTRAPHHWKEETDFAQVVLDHLKTSGVQQGHKEDRITFTSLMPWPGEYVAAEGRFMEGEAEKRAAIFIGPEFGTVARPDIVAAAREAADAGFGLLVACAFNFDAHASEFAKLGPVQVIRARMNPDLHMADDLKNTGAGNLFVVFGEPDVEIERLDDDQYQVRILGLDIFDPKTGEIRAGGTDDIAAWFVDTDYNEESFFVRHAYFLGAQDPYKALKTTLKAEIDEEAWESLYREISRPFPRPSSGRIAVKVINHFGDEVMKVFSV